MSTAPLRRARVAGVALALFGATGAIHANPACAGSFVQSSEPTVFDGVAFDLIRLESSTVTLLVFTFGAWRPEKVDGPARFGFTLRHRNEPGVHVGFCPLLPGDVPGNEQRWTDYVAAARTALGAESIASAERDSGKDEGVVEVLGLRTREVKLVAPAVGSTPARAEFHLVASDESTGVSFVLTGTPDEVENALPDFRFLLSRMSAR